MQKDLHLFWYTWLACLCAWQRILWHRQTLHLLYWDVVVKPTYFLSRWEFTDGGKEINQHLNSRAGLAVADHVFSDVRFTGTVFVNTDSDDDAIGFVFGYQNNKNFYVVTSSKHQSRQVYTFLWSYHNFPGRLEINPGQLNHRPSLQWTAGKNILKTLFYDFFFSEFHLPTWPSQWCINSRPSSDSVAAPYQCWLEGNQIAASAPNLPPPGPDSLLLGGGAARRWGNHPTPDHRAKQPDRERDHLWRGRTGWGQAGGLLPLSGGHHMVKDDYTVSVKTSFVKHNWKKNWFTTLQDCLLSGIAQFLPQILPMDSII